MRIISYTHARNNLAKTIDSVVADHAPVVISRQKGEPVVMISLAEYESLVETDYLLRSPANADRLSRSLAQLASGKTRKLKLPK
jgi:antitoxin YefM